MKAALCSCSPVEWTIVLYIDRIAPFKVMKSITRIALPLQIYVLKNVHGHLRSAIVKPLRPNYYMVDLQSLARGRSWTRHLMTKRDACLQRHAAALKVAVLA